MFCKIHHGYLLYQYRTFCKQTFTPVKRIQQRSDRFRIRVINGEEVSSDTNLVDEGRLSFSTDVVQYLNEFGLTNEDISHSIKKAVKYWQETHQEVPDLTLDRLNTTLTCLVNHGIPVKDLGELLKTSPPLLLASMEDNLIPRIQTFKNLKITGLSLMNILRSYPMVLLDGDTESMAQIVELFRKLGIHEEYVQKVIRRYPKLLTQPSDDVEKNISALSKFFTSGEDLVLCTTFNPFLIQESHERFEEVRDMFKALKLSEDEVLRLVQHEPTLMTKNLHNMKVILDWFLASDLTFDEVKKMVVTYPSLLIRKLSLLKLKKKFLTNIAGRPFRDILQNPVYFHTSIDRVIGPRFTFLRSRKDLKLQTVSLTVLVTVDNSSFATRIANVLEAEYLVYQAQWTRMYNQKFEAITKQRKQS